MQCSFKDRKMRGRTSKKINVHDFKRCTKTATWIIRKDGREFFACDTHKTEGFIVRKI